MTDRTEVLYIAGGLLLVALVVSTWALVLEASRTTKKAKRKPAPEATDNQTTVADIQARLRREQLAAARAEAAAARAVRRSERRPPAKPRPRDKPVRRRVSGSS